MELFSDHPPLVSCVLPTKNRAEYIPHAIRSYQLQTYGRRELVIVDNGRDDTEALIPPDPSIRYFKVGGNVTTGDMRNFCAAYAHGDVLCHFDSDDWSAPERLTDQVTRLGAMNIVTGYHSMLFYDERDGRCYHWQTSQQPWIYVLGTSLCYRKLWWQQHPFPSLRVGEDVRFYQQACREAFRLVSTAPAGRLMVARIHNAQTCRKTLTKARYRPVPPHMLPEGFPCGSISSVT